MSMISRAEETFQLAAKEWNESQYKVVESFQGGRAGSDGGMIYFVLFFAVVLLIWLALASAKRFR